MDVCKHFNTTKKTLLREGKTRQKQYRYQPLFPHSNMEGYKVPKLEEKLTKTINLVVILNLRVFLHLYILEKYSKPKKFFRL